MSEQMVFMVVVALTLASAAAAAAIAVAVDTRRWPAARRDRLMQIAVLSAGAIAALLGTGK